MIVGVLVEKGMLADDELESLKSAIQQSYIGKAPNEYILHGLRSMNMSELLPVAIDTVVESAGNRDFNIANSAIGSIQALKGDDIGLFDAEMKTRYLTNVARVTQGYYPSNSAVALMREGLGERADFIGDFLVFCQGNPSKVTSMNTDWRALYLMIVNTGVNDVEKVFVELVGRSKDQMVFLNMLHEIKERTRERDLGLYEHVSGVIAGVSGGV